jgi:hypothetical protein
MHGSEIAWRSSVVIVLPRQIVTPLLLHEWRESWRESSAIDRACSVSERRKARRHAVAIHISFYAASRRNVTRATD